MSDSIKRILIIEPYYGGSHKLFLKGLMRTINADYTVLSLPARKWKMRMQLSAPWFIEQIKSFQKEKRFFDTVLCSTFIDVAVFKAMSTALDGWNSCCRYCTYFHENQFAYPGFLDKHTNHQFTTINFTTALTSDFVAFNSGFNRDTFLHQCRKFLKKAADMDLSPCLDELDQKCQVIYPGIDFSAIDAMKAGRVERRIKRIVWNHRWEHDKNPDAFFDAMYRLADGGIEFELSILGQNFRNPPNCFEAARSRLGERIVHYGFADDVDEYYRRLVDGDIVVSTALHEFFGIAVLEAVRAGCLPVLPAKLAYPELFASRYLYEEGGLYERLKDILKSGACLEKQDAEHLTEPYSWQNQTAAYTAWLDI